MLKVATPYANGHCFAGFAGKLASLCRSIGKHSFTEFFVARQFENPKALALDTRGLLFACMKGSNAWAFDDRAVTRHSNIKSCILYFEQPTAAEVLPYVPYELRPLAATIQGASNGVGTWCVDKYVPPNGKRLLALLLLLSTVLVLAVS
jgi:hypothetical protein